MIKIEEAKSQDINEIVKIHQQAFPDFFLTSLGGSFLQLYYESVLKHKYGVLLVSKMDGLCIGLCAGTVKSAGFNASLIKANLFRYSIESLRILFKNPNSLLHLIKNMSKEDASLGDTGEYAELLSIAVNPNVQGSGAGKAMLVELEKEVKKRGGLRISLTTDYDNNAKTIGFYKSLGYETWYDFVTFPNRRMFRFIKNL